jgi:hypothetical protein
MHGVREGFIASAGVSNQRLFEFTFDPSRLKPLEVGQYSVEIQAEDLHGNVATSGKLRFMVRTSYKEVIIDWVKQIGSWAAIGYGTMTILVFVGLVLGSRWSRRCFELLTDPLVRRFGIYFGFALKHVRLIRLWVFERYYQRVKANLKIDHEYVDRLVRRIDGSGLLTTMLLEDLMVHPHIWLWGKPGTGKTEAVNMLMRKYFAAASLRQAWKRYKFIPIAVPLRHVTGRSLVEAAIDELRQNEMPFDDEKYFKRFFPSGDFLLLLDGFNEVALDEVAVLGIPPSVRVLVTSQTRVQETGEGVERLELSPVTPDFAGRLLLAFLGEEKGREAKAEVAKSLWDEIESGYDVKLIADLFGAGRKLPSNVLKLYDSLFYWAAALYSDDYPMQAVAQFAWNCWKQVKRRFKADETLSVDRLKPLQSAGIVVGRGTDFEFRHDLMRGYLAACWAVKYAAASAVTVERLREKEIWNLSPSDQESVFTFLTRLIETKEDLRLVGEFAAKEPQVRVVLLECVKKAASKKRWKLEIKLGDDEGPKEKPANDG